MPNTTTIPPEGIDPPRPRAGAIAALVAAALLAALPAAAEPVYKAGAITVLQPWSRATPGGSRLAVGYLTIRNDGDAPDRLVSAEAAVAGSVTPHSMVMRDGVMEMRPIAGGVAVPAHGSVAFAPDGDHLMLEGLKQSLKAGEHFPATLNFEHAGPVPVVFDVEAIGAKGPAGGAAGMSMKMN